MDDEILDEEEVEVMKLQGQQARAMTEADYGIEALSSGEDQEVGEIDHLAVLLLMCSLVMTA